MAFAFHCPTRIIHGIGALSGIGGVAASFGVARPLVVTDPIIAATEFYRAALASLTDTGLTVHTFEGAAVDARVSHIQEQAQRARADGIDGIVGIGGGSAMSTAKGIACMATNEGRFTDFRGYDRLASAPLPALMAPTTAGSGSEVSVGAVAYDEETETKFAVLSPLIYPKAAILDPVTLETVPERLGVESGLDALTHAVEAWLSTRATAVTDALAAAAIRMIARSLAPAIFERDPAAMTDQLLAASMAVIAFENAGVGMAHVLGRPIEGTFHIAHGRSVGVLMPQVVRLAARVMPGRIAALASMLGAAETPVSGDPGMEAVSAIEALYDRLDFAPVFDRAAVDPDRLEEMAAKAHLIQELGRPSPDEVTGETVIRAANGAEITVSDAAAAYRRCIAG